MWIKWFSKFFSCLGSLNVYDQGSDETCYAYASASAIREAGRHVEGYQEENYYQLVQKIIDDNGKKGANVRDVL